MEGKQQQYRQQQQQQQQHKGLLELCIFIAALATGTASSILAKVMYAATATDDDIDGKQRHFDKPIAQTFFMFLAMLFGMPAHWLVVAYKVPFPGYHHHYHHDRDSENDYFDHQHQHEPSSTATTSAATTAKQIDIDATPRIVHSRKHESVGGVDGHHEHESLLPTASSSACNNGSNDKDDADDIDDDDGNCSNIDDLDVTRQEPNMMTIPMPIPWKTYAQLAIPTFFDCTATALFMIGLLFLNVSVYQLLRGSGIIFVGLLRQYGLKQMLYKFQWVGLWYNVASAVLVGTAALMDSLASSSTSTSTSTNGGSNDDDASTIMISTTTNNLEASAIGVTFMMLGTLLQSMQFVLEEKFMVADEVKVPPLLLFGMEGFWGVIMTLCFLYPIAYYIPGHDQGSFETFGTAWEMILSTRYIRVLMFVSMVVIFAFNLCCVLVTFLLSSIWHAILDNFRPLTVWCTDLLLYYVIEQTAGARSVDQETRLGESWTPYSWLQMAGMAILIYGTAIYNAPDSGSILLDGKWYSLGMDFSQEYNKIAEERQVGQLRRSFGSYPSLNDFLIVSTRDLFWNERYDGNSIRFGKRAETLQPRKSPTLYGPSKNARYYSSMNPVDADRRQHSI